MVFCAFINSISFNKYFILAAKFFIEIMSNPQPINNERTPQWQSGPPDSVPVKTSDVLGHDLDKDNNEDTQPKVKTVENQSPVENSQRKQENSGISFFNTFESDIFYDF